MITDFTTNTDDLEWYIQNDSVMGGHSVGAFTSEADHLSFSGSTNTNGGGFSSIRSKPISLNLSMHSGVELTVEGDGRTYTWSIQTDATWRGRRISYWADFQTDKGIPSTVQIPFAKFYPQFRGFKLDGPPIDKSEISEFSLYIYDKKDGPFSIKLFSVGAY